MAGPIPTEIQAVSPWERAEPIQRPAPSRLTRDAIVSVAIALADQEGLAAVSLRKVATALNTGPMRLYGYVATKEELLEFMVDAVFSEMMLDGPFEGEWRVAMGHMADRMRSSALRHPWIAALIGGRPRRGPGSLAHLEASLAAFAKVPGFEDIDAVMKGLRAVMCYVVGAIQSEVSNASRGQSRIGDQATLLDPDTSFMKRMADTGRYPQICRVISNHSHPSPDAAFRQGLECVLRGIDGGAGLS